MAGLLEHVNYDFDRRMTARRGMMAHLGLCPDEAEASEIREELRATLLACGRCDAPRALPGLAEDRVPRNATPACCAREAFARLEVACSRLRNPPGLQAHA